MQDDYKSQRRERIKKLKRRRRRIVIFSVLLLLISCFLVLSFTVLFPVKTVNSAGSQMYSAEEITAACNIKSKNIFTLNSDNLESKVREKLPFVDSLTIKRSFPDTVNITVKDAEAYAYYLAEDGCYTVSRKGYVLEHFLEKPENLLEIVCGNVKCEIGKPAEISSETEKKLVANIISYLEAKSINAQLIDVSNPISITLRVDGRFNVNLGSSNYLERKISHLSGMIENIAPDRSGSINLSMWSPQKSEGGFVADQ